MYHFIEMNELYLLQIIFLVISSFYIYSKQLVKKLFNFLLLLIWLGVYLIINELEVMSTFLWVLELSFILVLILLIIQFNFNSSLNQTNQKQKVYTNYLDNLFLLLIPIIYCIIYFFNLNITESNIYELQSEYTLLSITALTNLYKQFTFINGDALVYKNWYTQLSYFSTLSTSDIKDIGQILFSLYPQTLCFFLLLLLYVSLLLIIIHFISDNKLYQNLQYITKLTKVYLKEVQQLGRNQFIKTQDLDSQLLQTPNLRVL